MPNNVWPSIHAKIMRLTKLDSCGQPITGASNKSMLVTKGIVKISITAETEDGEDTVKKNGNGEICVQHKDPDQIKYLAPEIEFCGVDPEAWSMITGQPLVLDGAGDAAGIKISSAPIEANFALEVWTDVPGAACGAGGNQPFGYFLLPFVGSGKVGDIELSVSAAEFTLSAQTKPGTGWGVGPYAVVRDEDNAAVPLLEALTPQDHAIMQTVTVAPPTPTDGAVELTPVTPPTGP
ncbi:hypothetical protein ACK8HH_17125 [Gordonia sp. LUNF6]|uniref:hypothetical protein n=1 Tax=unclassified Gordonia (in: high G+C Gram-positive bacteria) TaxID=2657482 RepID=UPI000782CAA6|nr:hypothetical protein [Gordonia sp. QH-12]